ncbi:LexA-binding, inner membrane-associated putative hydrolase [Plasticicumulans lactativorans]|uniref:LexA-binding, inner membrane-associated putative hydrolase n=1 Tax=Plasticicumulans lactativorans TaxID=1133106 RepID=A0A4R2LA12_9GAMM|nr:metal-dependent hydrolase [Plasticicumulans lactativorans]TCO83658.1 LexA-binding, inner membrane-associated putative hydrolase [Plasticicumulans lactativorans]
MANFHTHLIGAAALSGVAATALTVGGVLPRELATACWALGTVGGLLPDIDLESSIPGRVAFTLVALLGAFAAMLVAAPKHSLAELAVLWCAAYGLLRHGVFGLVNRYTVHRGLVHSLPAAAVFALATVVGVHRGLGASATTAWLAGLFIGFGFLVHLLLDECFSVDLLGRRLKRSFGTALSLGDPRQPLATLAVYAAAALLWSLAPPAPLLWEALTDQRLLHTLQQRAWPAHGWFEGGLTLLGDALHKLQ